MEANFFYLDAVPSSDSTIGQSSQPQTTPSSSVNQTSNVTTRNDGSNLASRVESLENLVSDVRENWAKKGQDANFNNLDVKERLTANFGKIGGFDVSSGVLSTNKLIIDSNNENIRSTNYQTGTSGFKVSSELVEAENGVFRGTIKGSTFAYDKISAVGGQLLISNADTLASDMSPLDSSALVVKGDTSFAVNDILVMRATATSGIQEEWLRVTAVNGNSYTVTRDLAGLFTANFNPAWMAGTPIVKQGSSDGVSTYSGGWLRLIGEGTNAPFYSIYKRTGVAYNAITEVGRMGNLNGIGGISTDVYGIYMGDTGKYFSWDGTDLNIKGTVQSQVGDILLYSLDTERTTTNTSYSKIKSIKITRAGSYRISFGIRSQASFTTYGRIYKNGVAVGTERSTTQNTPLQEFSEDISSFAANDEIQLYIKKGPEAVAGVSAGGNFRVYVLNYDNPSTITDTNA